MLVAPSQTKHARDMKLSDGMNSLAALIDASIAQPIVSKEPNESSQSVSDSPNVSTPSRREAQSLLIVQGHQATSLYQRDCQSRRLRQNGQMKRASLEYPCDVVADSHPKKRNRRELAPSHDRLICANQELPQALLHPSVDPLSAATSSLSQQEVDDATHSVVGAAIDALLWDEDHTRKTMLKHGELLSGASLPGVVPISHQILKSAHPLSRNACHASHSEAALLLHREQSQSPQLPARTLPFMRTQVQDIPLMPRPHQLIMEEAALAITATGSGFAGLAGPGLHRI